MQASSLVWIISGKAKQFFEKENHSESFETKFVILR